MELQNQKPPISLIMIVRNSGGRLKDVIEWHRECVSEIIVVDQSSTDGTWDSAEYLADIAVKRRNKGKCEGDRNFAFQLGTQPWVLNLDDDEYLTEDSKKRLPDFLEKADIVWLKRKNLIDGVPMEFMGDDPQCRLFRRGAVRWADETHKFPDKAENTVVYHSDLTIEHRRTYQGVLDTHQRRSRVLEPDAMRLEENFIHSVGSELRKAGKNV